VAIKNVEPNAESRIENGASLYSNACRAVNTIPSIIVVTSESFLSFSMPLIILWCDQVTVTPDDRSRIVFRSGMFKGSKGVIPFGGHNIPTSALGEMLLWKKAQKKDKKNSTSEAINSNIPVFNPFITSLWCSPCFIDSRSTSRHHA
jgi:hypothetical protein